MNARMRAALCMLLASTTARAEPDGYRGGAGRPPGTTYVPAGGGPSLTVRGVTVEAGRADGGWSCGGVAAPRSTEDLVTVTLVVANPTRRPVSGTLANVDLVYETDGQGVAEGACVRGERADTAPDLGAKRTRIVRARFLVPRGATPKILVYNDDDFPALFALPRAAKRASLAPRRSR